MSEDDLVPLLIDAVYHYRAIAYVVSTAKPSEGGLRMDLDRFRKLVDDVHRDYKKNAGEVVRSTGHGARSAGRRRRGRHG